MTYGPSDNFATVKWMELLLYVRQVPSSILGPNSSHTHGGSSSFIGVPMAKCPASDRGGPGSIPGHFTWNLWWKKWHWDRFLTEYFDFPLSIPLHHCCKLVVSDTVWPQQQTPSLNNTQIMKCEDIRSVQPRPLPFASLAMPVFGVYVRYLVLSNKPQKRTALFRAITQTVV